jgi:predicted RNase H-like HicB family nuclease
MELEYTYTEEPDGWLVGYLNMYPDHMTQGKDVAELEIMLADVYAIIKDEKAIFAEMEEIERQEKARQRKGVITIASEVLA